MEKSASTSNEGSKRNINSQNYKELAVENKSENEINEKMAKWDDKFTLDCLLAYMIDNEKAPGESAAKVDENESLGTKYDIRFVNVDRFIVKPQPEKSKEIRKKSKEAKKAAAKAREEEEAKAEVAKENAGHEK